MSTIIMRSALVYHGHNPAPDVAYVVSDHHGRRKVTWADVLKARRERQRQILANRCPFVRRRPERVWVGYFDRDLFGGWQAFIGDHRGRDYECWIDRDARHLKPLLMEAFPLDVPDELEWKRWERWKAAFANAHEKGRHHGRPRGSAIVWRGPQGRLIPHGRTDAQD